MTRPQIGDERYLLEIISAKEVMDLAKKNGRTSDDDGIHEYCEPADAADYIAFKTLDKAVDKAKEWLATGDSFYGCAIIDQQVYEQWHDDRGNRVMGADWEVRKSYEVAMDMDVIEVDR